MPSFRFLALAAVAAALVVVAPAIGDSGAARGSAVPPAQIAGDGGTVLLPSIVDTRLVRAQAALDRATADFDEGQPAQAVVPIGAAVDNVTKGWNAAKWVVQTAPAPPPVDDALRDEPLEEVGATYASPPETAVAVLAAQHDVVSTSVGMMETGNAALLARLTSAITSMQTARTNAINWIHSLEPPPPPDDRAVADDEDAVDFATLMPGYVAVLDDEIQQLSGRLALYNFSAPAKSALTSARARAQEAKALINQYWPPVGDD